MRIAAKTRVREVPGRALGGRSGLQGFSLPRQSCSRRTASRLTAWRPRCASPVTCSRARSNAGAGTRRAPGSPGSPGSATNRCGVRPCSARVRPPLFDGCSRSSSQTRRLGANAQRALGRNDGLLVHVAHLHRVRQRRDDGEDSRAPRRLRPPAPARRARARTSRAPPGSGSPAWSMRAHSTGPPQPPHPTDAVVMTGFLCVTLSREASVDAGPRASALV